MTTEHSVSPEVSRAEVLVSLIVLTLLYGRARGDRGASCCSPTSAGAPTRSSHRAALPTPAPTSRWPSRTDDHETRDTTMELTTVWFILIAVLWIGYFCLEGFDFGVGMLLPVLARNDTERRVLINTIGPVWDGNEVWVLVAGGATFAAFPEWYATLFSGFYLPLLLILVALIVRGLAFEYRAKRDDAALAAQLGPGPDHRVVRAGSAVGSRLRQHPARRADRRGPGVRRRLLQPAQPLRPAGRPDDAAAVPHPRRDVRLAQDRRPDPRGRTRAWPSGSALVAAVVTVAFLLWTQIETGTVASAIAFVAGRRVAAGRARRCDQRPRGLGASSGPSSRSRLGVAGLFLGLFPDVMPTTLADGVSPDHHQRVGHALHAQDHDRGRAHLHAGRADLPGLDLLGLPQADRDPPHPDPVAPVRRRPMRPSDPLAPSAAGPRAAPAPGASWAAA